MALALVDTASNEDDSFVQLPIRVLKNHDLSLGARLTYAALSSFAWQSDECWPSQETLAETLGTSKRSIVRYIQELVDACLIERMRPKHQAARYRFLIRGASAKLSLADESKCQITSEQVPNFHLASAKLAHEVYTENKTQEDDDVARTRKIDEPIRRVLAAFGMTEAPWSVNAISERLARYEEAYPGLDAVAEAEGLRSESDAEGRKAGNWLARWDGWMRTASQRQERVRQSPPPQSTPSPPSRIPLPVEPVDCPEVPAWGKLVNHLYGQFQAKRGQAPAEHPRAWTIFGCRPLPADSTSAVLALETHEPPDVAAELAKDVKWWLAGACLGGMQVEVTSRWAS